MTTPPPAAASTEAPAVAAPSGNQTLAQLAATIKRGRKAASPPAATTGPSVARSEQAKTEAAADDSVLSQSATSEHPTAPAAPEAGTEAEETTTTPEAPDGAGEGDGTTEAAAEGDKKPERKSIEKMEKRISTLTEQRNTAREEIEHWKAKALQAETGRTPPAAKAEAHAADDVFAARPEVREIDKALSGADAFLSWAAKNPDGGSFTTEGKTYELNADEVDSFRRQSEKEARRLEAKREARIETLRGEFAAQRKSSYEEARRLYPWIEQQDSPEFQEALAILREHPALQQRPDFELVLARQVTGYRLEREAAKKLKGPAPKPAAARAATPVVTHAASAARRSDANTDAARAVESQMQQHVKAGKISTNDLAKLLAQKRSLRNAAA